MAKLIKRSGIENPNLMSIIYSDNTNEPVYAAINVNVVTVGDEYVWDALELPDFALNNIHNAPKDIKYNVLVAHVIKAYYDDNAMTAIVNNYLLDMGDAKYKSEFDEMQKVRKLAKDTARYIVNTGLF